MMVAGMEDGSSPSLQAEAAAAAAARTIQKKKRSPTPSWLARAQINTAQSIGNETGVVEQREPC